MRHSRNQSHFSAALLAGAIALAIGVGLPHRAEAADFRGVSVEVVGDGTPVLMIPGLNSGMDTWRDTCSALQPQVQCHLVQLPGFAGQPAVEEEAYLEGMRDRLLGYVDSAKLEQPVVVGHSLGGVVAMQMAIARPEAVGKLVVVDALPYLGAAQNPAATAEQVNRTAGQMRAAMEAADDASYMAQLIGMLPTQTRTVERLGTLEEWARASDRAVTTQALYEVMTTDLRAEVGRIEAPTLVLASWAGYAPLGATPETVRGGFEAQYAALDGVQIEMSADGYHFLMWDDPQWLRQHVREFVGAAPDTAAR